MKIVLINPPSPYLDDDTAYPPTGLMYLAASLEHEHHQVSIVDLTGGVNFSILDTLKHIDMFGITCTTPNFNIVKNIVKALPKPTPVIVGGPHPTFLPAQTLRDIGCDAIVTGEGELIIHRLISDIASGNLRKFYSGANVPLTIIPPPARHLVDLKKYRSAATIYTSRGCHFDCAFCSKITGRTFRAFSESRVIEEVTSLIALGYNHITFGDDDVSIGIPRLRELLALLKPLGITFRLNQDARDVDETTTKLAAESGCTEISFGIESGSQDVLDAMNKMTTVEANRRAIEITKDHGISVKAYLMVNFPGETESTVQETIEFIKATNPDTWLLSSFAPLPGSATFHNPKKYNITWLSKNWDDYYIAGSVFTPCFSTPDLSPEKQIYLYNLLKEELVNLGRSNRLGKLKRL